MNLQSGKNDVTFNSKGLKLAGHLYLPENFDSNKKYKAIVMTPPSHQIKEQTMAQYAPKFAEKDYIVLAFDYNSKGKSESYQENTRNDENALRKQEDLRNAISYLRSHSFVDRDKLYGIGVCAGGNVMSSVIITDLRVKAFASVSAMLATDIMFYSDKDTFISMMNSANELRQQMYETGEPVNIDLFGFDDPNYLKKENLSLAQVEGFDYYGTPRANQETYPDFSNKVLGNINETVALNIGQQYADKMVQPFIGIVGERAETAFSTKDFYDKVTSEKEYYVVPNASHVDLYDKKEYVSQVADKIDDFFEKH